MKYFLKVCPMDPTRQVRQAPEALQASQVLQAPPRRRAQQDPASHLRMMDETSKGFKFLLPKQPIIDTFNDIVPTMGPSGRMVYNSIVDGETIHFIMQKGEDGSVVFTIDGVPYLVDTCEKLAFHSCEMMPLFCNLGYHPKIFNLDNTKTDKIVIRFRSIFIFMQTMPEDEEVHFPNCVAVKDSDGFVRVSYSGDFHGDNTYYLSTDLDKLNKFLSQDRELVLENRGCGFTTMKSPTETQQYLYREFIKSKLEYGKSRVVELPDGRKIVVTRFSKNYPTVCAWDVYGNTQIMCNDYATLRIVSDGLRRWDYEVPDGYVYGIRKTPEGTFYFESDKMTTAAVNYFILFFEANQFEPEISGLSVIKRSKLGPEYYLFNCCGMRCCKNPNHVFEQ